MTKTYVGRHRLNRDCQRHGHAWNLPDFTELREGDELTRWCERCPATEVNRVARTVSFDRNWSSDEPVRVTVRSADSPQLRTLDSQTDRVIECQT